MSLGALTEQAIEYAKEGIRFNAVAPGVVDSPMNKDVPKDVLKTFQPMGKIVEIKDVVSAVTSLYSNRMSLRSIETISISRTGRRSGPRVYARRLVGKLIPFSTT